MISICGNFIKILIIAIFLCAEISTSFAADETLQQFISRECNNIENLPERLCNKVIGTVETKLTSACGTIGKTICENPLAKAISFFLSTATCESAINKYVCRLVNTMSDFATDECVDELHKVIIGSTCDADGNEVSICDGLSGTASSMCNFIVDEACDEIPWFLDPLTPICQELLSDTVCAVL